jgi:hypothetical protein
MTRLMSRRTASQVDESGTMLLIRPAEPPLRTEQYQLVVRSAGADLQRALLVAAVSVLRPRSLPQIARIVAVELVEVGIAALVRRHRRLHGGVQDAAAADDARRSRRSRLMPTG